MSAAAPLPDDPGPDAADGQRRDPFQAPYDDACYFEEAVRVKRLNLLFHLIPYSDVLLVTGEAGSGKTAVLHRLLAGASDSWRMCRIQATAETDGAQLLDVLYREFSLRPEANEGADQRLRLLRESLYALRHSALVPVLVIDDAHLLAHSSLAMLAALTDPWESKDRLLSVVMFGEPEINKRLIAPGLETLRARVSHTFDIPPFSEEDTGRYIRHRLQTAGMSGTGPFTDSVIKFIHVASRGFPGRINEFARVVLHNSEQKETHPAASASLGSRTRVYFKYGIAAVLASAAAVGLLYQDRLMELAGRGGGAPAPAVGLARTAPAPEVGPVPETAAAAPSMPMDESASPAPDEIPSSVVPPPEPADGAPDSTPETGLPAEPVEPRQAEVAVPAEPVGETDPEEAAAAPVDRETDRVETAPEPGQSVIPATAPAPSPVAAGPRDEDWLLSQDPGAYTLQLLVASRAQCLAYIERHGLSDAAALYQTHSSGEVWYSLVYGVYATEVDAADAGKAISDQDVKSKPWVRRLATVQARIREFRTGTATVSPASSPNPAIINKGVSAPSGDIRNANWLIEQSPETFTLQLFSGKESNVMAYLKRHELSDQVALYQPPDGAGRLTVTYGIYSSRTEAVQAAKELSSRLPDVKPWARSLREIQALISPPVPAEVAPAPVPPPPQANQ